MREPQKHLQETIPECMEPISHCHPMLKNIKNLDDGAINYQTSLIISEVIEFYRSEFANAGYEEREITTVINDTTFSIIWDGFPNGKAIVVQRVDLGDGTINVNIRFEDV